MIHAILRAGLSWIGRLFGWWCPLRLGRAHIVVLPDHMSILMLALAGFHLVAFAGWHGMLSFCGALLLSPFLCLTLVHVTRSDVRVLRCLLFVPYWIRTVPEDAWFDVYDSWDDPAPTGIAFTPAQGRGKPLHLGTTATAWPLYHHVSAILEHFGWERALSGWRRPQASCARHSHDS